jgi:hypothetical protein
VFDPEHVSEFDVLAEARVARMSAPFFGHRSKVPGEAAGNHSLGLFVEQDHD